MNHEATKVFLELTQKLGKNSRLELRQGVVFLVLQKTGQVDTAYGRGICFTLSQYYFIKNEASCDPKMTFILVDARNFLRWSLSNVCIFAGSLRRDPFKEAVSIPIEENGKLGSIDRYLQDIHSHIANEWLKRVSALGFLSVRPELS
ncbi:MAG: hypothetical protein P4L51_28620 [Puia sp.]|nr:hypothetical protein [Puia sp.]